MRSSRATRSRLPAKPVPVQCSVVVAHTGAEMETGRLRSIAIIVARIVAWRPFGLMLARIAVDGRARPGRPARRRRSSSRAGRASGAGRPGRRTRRSPGNASSAIGPSTATRQCRAFAPSTELEAAVLGRRPRLLAEARPGRLEVERLVVHARRRRQPPSRRSGPGARRRSPSARRRGVRGRNRPPHRPTSARSSPTGRRRCSPSRPGARRRPRSGSAPRGRSAGPEIRVAGGDHEGRVGRPEPGEAHRPVAQADLVGDRGRPEQRRPTRASSPRPGPGPRASRRRRGSKALPKWRAAPRPLKRLVPARARSHG